MAEKDTADPTSSTPTQEPLTVSGAADRLLDRFPEEPSSPKEPDPKPTEDAEPEPDETPVTDEAESGGLEDEPTESAPEPPPLHKVKVDGVEEEITLEEALKGYSRTADYRNKTRQLAEDRRKVETESQAARQARDAYGERLKLVDQALAVEPTPDWVKAKEEMTTEEFLGARADWQLKVEQRQEVKAERERVAGEQATEVAQQQQVYLDEQAELLQEKIPEFAKVKADLLTYGETQGFSRDEIAGVNDHRALVLLNKARLYDALVARKAKTKEKATTVPTVKPGGRPPSSEGSKARKAQEAARQRLRESGKLEDATAALMDMD